MEKEVTLLAALLKNTAEEHHAAFTHTHGNDPTWALWYAKKLNTNAEFTSLIKPRMKTDELADVLTTFDASFRAQKEESSWERYYAQRLFNKT